MMRTIIENQKKETPFQMFFLKNDKTQSVEIVEADQIKFKKVKSHLAKGESVFIPQKQEQKPNMRFIEYDLATEPWYFIHS